MTARESPAELNSNFLDYRRRMRIANHVVMKLVLRMRGRRSGMFEFKSVDFALAAFSINITLPPKKSNNIPSGGFFINLNITTVNVLNLLGRQ